MLSGVRTMALLPAYLKRMVSYSRTLSTAVSVGNQHNAFPIPSVRLVGREFAGRCCFYGRFGQDGGERPCAEDCAQGVHYFHGECSILATGHDSWATETMLYEY